MRIFPLKQISMIACCESVLAEVIQTQQCGKTNTTHTAFQGTFLSVQTVRENPLVSCQMQGFVFIRIVCFLENRYIIGAAFMEICVFVGVDRIDFQTDDFEIFLCNFAGFPDVLYCGFAAAFSGKNQDFPQSCFGDGCHFFIDFFFVQLGTVDFIMAVETAVNAVVFAVVGNVDRCEHVYTVTKMLSGFHTSCLCDVLQQGQSGRGEQCGEILRGTAVMD